MVLLGSSAMMFGQGARNIKINEVLTDNQTSVQDEFGQHLPWLELVNTSFSTYNIRGMFITSDRKVLDKNLTAPQRIALMSPVPNGDNRSSLSARQHLVVFLNSNPTKGFSITKTCGLFINIFVSWNFRNSPLDKRIIGLSKRESMPNSLKR